MPHLHNSTECAGRRVACLWTTVPRSSRFWRGSDFSRMRASYASLVSCAVAEYDSQSDMSHVSQLDRLETQFGRRTENFASAGNVVEAIVKLGAECGQVDMDHCRNCVCNGSVGLLVGGVHPDVVDATRVLCRNGLVFGMDEKVCRGSTARRTSDSARSRSCVHCNGIDGDQSRSS